MPEPADEREMKEASGAVGQPVVGASAQEALGSATYEIIRQRLLQHGEALRLGLARLDERRREVFGSVGYQLLQADRIVTSHNCVPRDMVQLGQGRFLFGFNVHFGLKRQVDLGDVFAVYVRDGETGSFREESLEVLRDPVFEADFKRLYNVYEKSRLRKFSVIEGRLYMVFGTGAGVNDIAVFKWAFEGGGLRYMDGRAEAEYRRVGFPPQYDFRWLTPGREAYRYGDHPHVSIEDRLFVECTEGDLTIKVEDNTDTGQGIYAEPVEDKNQKVDDAEIAYALMQHLVVLRVRPYKEADARYFIYNGKQRTVVRVDSIGQSCVRLPEDHGLIFPDGVCLATGEVKRFESREKDLLVERVVHAPNGEDSLYVFYNRLSGDYVLMPYRLIEQKVEQRLGCHGFSIFPNGHVALFRAEQEAQKHHLVQVWQTPFHEAGQEPAGQREAFLYQVGNKAVVRCLAEGNEVMTLLRKEEPYAELYTDVVRRCGAMLDAYSWLGGEEGYGVGEALGRVREAADRAVDEFDKVRRLQREAGERMELVRGHCEERMQAVRRTSFKSLDDYVGHLAGLRRLRGDLLALREVRYVDVGQVGEVEAAVVGQTDELAQATVKFLLLPEALDGHRGRADGFLRGVEVVGKAAEGRALEKEIGEAGGGLEMLVEVVNSLKIEDATETTRILDGITSVYATLNQAKAALKQRLKELASKEGAAQFAAQLKLLSQSASSYLDLCDTPARCDEYLNRISVQLEELEGAFADFEDYTVELAGRRAELYEAFEQRKLALVEERNRRAGALMGAAERILKVIQSRLAGFESVEEIHTYMVSDLMVSKVRDTMGHLMALEDSVKADDLAGRLKSVQQDAVRQLKDRQELFVGGQAVIRLGRHRFNVNTQALDLTVVQREGEPCFHLTSTQYFEVIRDEAFLGTREAWGQEVVSEDGEVYRAEYLAQGCLAWLLGQAGGGVVGELEEGVILERVREYMGGRYQEGYVKGVHDADGAKILRVLAEAHRALGLARYAPEVRACAVVYWQRFCPDEVRALWGAKLRGLGRRNRLFPGDTRQEGYRRGLEKLLGDFVRETGLYTEGLCGAAAGYLVDQLTSSEGFVLSREGREQVTAFEADLVRLGAESDFRRVREEVASHPGSELELVRDWVRGFLSGRAEGVRYLEEVAAVLFCGEGVNWEVVEARTRVDLEGMKGSHRRIAGGVYRFDYLDFRKRLGRFEAEVVPRFNRYQEVKRELLDAERERLRLGEFKPRVLTSFVRNQLIDEVYLPLIGDNLAKQVGAAGDQKRTDLMGLLLVISPPGYGKTTLMEYIANRLGIVFVKINGPALGHGVTSLDPEEAPNAAAREEVRRLNLALEMGDNAMIYVDDIQHCHAEFLQKFISLCDAQRKIEGVWRGRPRTYDLRGRKVVVVMAGNPYTESGLKFRIPDMLANRADTYNLGDILGGSAEAFRRSYLENAVTSNATLAPLANKSQKDIRAFIRMAETGERDLEGLEGSYAAQEVEELLSVMVKLVAVREVILRVNQEYIHSAGQADAYRTEPAFKLQGSYRNMNRLAEKVVPILSEAEVRALVVEHYRGESQTLTTGAEANLLKFKELLGVQTEAEAERWADIKRVFRRNLLSQGGEGSDPVGRVVAQLSAFESGLDGIRQTLEAQFKARNAGPSVVVDLGPVEQGLAALRGVVSEALAKRGEATKPESAPLDLAPLAGQLEAMRSVMEQGLRARESAGVSGTDAVVSAAHRVGAGLEGLRADLTRVIQEVYAATTADRMGSVMHEMEMVHSTLATLKDIAARQRDYLRSVEEMLLAKARDGTVEIRLTQEMMENEQAFLEQFQRALSVRGGESGKGGEQEGASQAER